MKIAHAVFIERSGKVVPHLLADHMYRVSRLAEQFAEMFNNADWGKVAGQLHDLGKGSEEFQKYIRDVTGYERSNALQNFTGKGPNHSSHGAVWVSEKFGGLTSKILVYLISGHHAGLADYHTEIGGGGSVTKRFAPTEVEKLPKLDPVWVADVTDTIIPPATPPTGKRLEGAEFFHLWVRLLFSCLVDADFLNTECFMDCEKQAYRNAYSPIHDLKEQFEVYMDNLVFRASKKPTEVNALRHRILTECREGASMTPGFFSLTVPTGGGKTLSGMAFALEHAIHYKKDRIIIAIPYTSIIEQTAAEYKKIFGEENVLEHHSSIDPEKETLKARLASENWDAPIIVTTNVQLFESLFAARTSKCRKLHNIVNSVIICDEAQMLPPEYLKPILSVSKGLVECFDVSMILCTATQPSLVGMIGSGAAKFCGIKSREVREIISDPEGYSRSFQRVEVEVGGHFEEWRELAGELANLYQVLCIVNTRKDCRDLYTLMPKENTVLLSANLCAEHRSRIIGKIKEALVGNKPIRAISTQLIEAGVDIDFPVVYRAIAGFDSIAQAAGRCNREGKLRENGRKVKGRVVVFTPPKLAPPGFLRKGADAGSEIMRLDFDGCRALQPAVFKKYFKLFYQNGISSFDYNDIESLLVKDAHQGEFQFRTAAKRFRLIDDQNQVAVVVWYEGRKSSGQKLIEQLKKYGPSRALLRKMQRFTVTIPEKEFREHEMCFDEIDGVWCQDVHYAYDEILGFVGLNQSQHDGAIIA